VVVGREFGDRPVLIREIAARYPEKASKDGVTLYLAP
jgi:hypothetical protein